MTSLNLIFMGTPTFAVPTLTALIGSKHRMVAVYTQPPRPAGRGQKPRPSPVQLLAEEHSISVYTPTTLKTEDAQAEFAALKPDVAVVAAYGLILPQVILDTPTYGCLNIHPSLLPRWRGAAPIQRAVMAGDKKTGIVIMQMDAGLDTGDMLLTETIPITDTMNAGELHDLMASRAAPLLLKAIDGATSGTLTPTLQPAEGITYANKISKEEAHIDWNQPAATIINHIRGLSPTPGAYALLNGEMLKIFAATPITSHQPPITIPGTILDNSLAVACKDGVIRLTTIQRPGKPRMQAEEFLRGQPVETETILR